MSMQISRDGVAEIKFSHKLRDTKLEQFDVNEYMKFLVKYYDEETYTISCILQEVKEESILVNLDIDKPLRVSRGK